MPFEFTIRPENNCSPASFTQDWKCSLSNNECLSKLAKGHFEKEKTPYLVAFVFNKLREEKNKDEVRNCSMHDLTSFRKWSSLSEKLYSPLSPTEAQSVVIVGLNPMGRYFPFASCKSKQELENFRLEDNYLERVLTIKKDSNERFLSWLELCKDFSPILPKITNFLKKKNDEQRQLFLDKLEERFGTLATIQNYLGDCHAKGTESIQSEKTTQLLLEINFNKQYQLKEDPIAELIQYIDRTSLCDVSKNIDYKHHS